MAAISAGLIALIIASVAGSLGAAGISAWSANENVKAQKDINTQNVEAQENVNAQNIQAQKEINQQNIDYSREFAQNGIQWKMQDLEAAGLNPTLAAGNGVGASPGTLSAPTAKAPVQQAPQFDLSGVSSALTALNNTMLTAYLLNNRNDIQADRNDVMREKNDVLNNLYKRKAVVLGNTLTGNAKQVSSTWSKAKLDKEWSKILKDLDKIK